MNSLGYTMNSSIATNKRLSTPLILLAVVVLVAMGIFVFQYLNEFTEQNLKAIKIKLHLVQENANADSNQEYFVLSLEEKKQLAIALDNITSGELKTEDISYQYNLVLLNKFGFAREYTLIFTANDVFLQDLKVEEPNFFFSHPGFNHIYSDRLAPGIQVTLNDNQGIFTKISRQWSYLRHDGHWNTQGSETELSEAELKNSNGTNMDATILSSEDNLAVETEKTPDHSHLKIIDLATDSIFFEGEIEELEQLPLPNRNGSYEYLLTLNWLEETKPYRGQAVISFSLVLELPEKFVFSKQNLIQGDMIEISVYNGENIDDLFLEQSIYAGFRWYNQDGLIRGYLPTNFSIKPGIYNIKYGNREKGTEFTQEIEIVAHTYRIQHLTIDPQIAQTTRNDAAYAEFAKYFTPVRKESAPTRYYTENFILPTKGRLTTEFGQTRYINGSPTSYRHSGLDIAAPTGTAVKATNRGKVVLAMPLILTGNSIVIDHGEGLFSVYYHMHENLVEAGEIVERGQKIATVGTTGFSTGPHLHFTMSYYLTNIEPGFFLVGQPITIANYRELMQD